MPILSSLSGASAKPYGLTQGFFDPGPVVGSPVAGYYMWLDAAHDASFTYSSGKVVSQWTDRSANALTFTTASVSNQPSRNGVQYGRPTVSFDGTNDYLKSTASSATWKFLHDGTATTIFLVAKSKPPAVDGSSTNWYMSSSYLSDGFELYKDSYYNPDQIIAKIRGSGFLQNYQTLPNNSHVVYSLKLDPNNATDANKLVQYHNSGSALTPTFVYTWATSTADSGTPLFLGTGYNGNLVGNPEYMLYGEIAEVLIYKSILSDTDRNANISYLKTKWGIA